MNKNLRHALREAADIASAGARVAVGAPLLPILIPTAVAAVATFTATALAAGLATEAGHAILGELRRRARLRAPHPPSPSLRGTPTAAELADDVMERPRTLAIRLRLGSRLADLAPTLDSGNRYNIVGAGAKRISGRGRGFKGWLEDNRVPASYGTLMRYKRLAVRLRALLKLDERIPLEWLLPGAAPDVPLPAGLPGKCTIAKRRLARLLREHWNFSRLQKHVDAALGLTRLPVPGRTDRIAVDDALAESTRREIATFLRAPDLTPRQEKLRLRTVRWIDGCRTGL